MANNQSIPPAAVSFFQRDVETTSTPEMLIQKGNPASGTVFLLFQLLLSAAGTFGNVLVVMAITLAPRMRNTTNWVILSLAFTDLTVCTFTVPLAIYNEKRESLWGLGAVLCYLWTMLDYFMSVSSIWHLCALSVDRYIALFRPLWYRTKRGKSLGITLISLSWGMGFLTSVSTLVVSSGHYHTSSGVSLCFISVPSVVFALFLFTVSFALPTGILVVLYTKMTLSMSGRIARVDVFALDLRGSSDNGMVDEAPAVASTAAASVEDPFGRNGVNEVPLFTPHSNVAASRDTRATMRCQGVRQQTIDAAMLAPPPIRPNEREVRINRLKHRGRFVKHEKKAAMIIAIVVFTFLVCWGPFFVIALLSVVCRSCTWTSTVFPFLTWLGYCNSAINPIIYTIFNPRFRVAFLNTLKCKYLKRRYHN